MQWLGPAKMFNLPYKPFPGLDPDHVDSKIKELLHMS